MYYGLATQRRTPPRPQPRIRWTRQLPTGPVIRWR
jgi:hypothetical protein